MTYLQPVDPAQIADELEASPRQPAFETASGYPLNFLTDRQFEGLLADLLNLETMSPNCRYGVFDNAVLMQGVGERGRDVSLFHQGTACGVVQCKKHQNLFTKPDAAREIIKFVLHSTLDASLIPDCTKFTYVLAVSNDFNERAKMLLAGFNKAILKETDLDHWISEVIENNVGLAQIDHDKIRCAKSTLESIKIVASTANDINTLLVKHSTVAEKYFVVKRVISEGHAQEIKASVDKLARSINSSLAEFIDADVQNLIKQMAKHPSDRRLDFGIATLWGYPREYLRHLLTKGKFRDIFLSMVASKAELDSQFIGFLSTTIDDQIFLKLTSRRYVSPIIIMVARPYLFGRLSRRWGLLNQGKEIYDLTQRAKETLKTDFVSARKHVVDAGVRVLNNDWSEVAGEGEFLALKKRVMRESYSTYKSRDHMERTIDEMWPLFQEILDEIEENIAKLIPDDPQVVLGGTRFWDDTNRLSNVFQGLQALATDSQGRFSDDASNANIP